MVAAIVPAAPETCALAVKASGPAGVLLNSEPIQFQFDRNGNPNGMRMANVKKFERL